MSVPHKMQAVFVVGNSHEHDAETDKACQTTGTRRAVAERVRLRFRCRSFCGCFVERGQIISFGTNLTLSATANGTRPLFFQWRHNGTNLFADTNYFGIDSPSLTISNVQSEQLGAYSVLVTNAFGSTVSGSAIVGLADTQDDDGDGIPNWWESAFGLNLSNPLDANTKPTNQNERLTYFQKHFYNLDPTALDTDGDGFSDYDELFVVGTNPAKMDTDDDGMPDAWEIQHGLNPLVNDAGGDLDLDGVTNLQEYQNRAHGYRPDRADSLGDGRSDYERLFGRPANRFYYDRNDRLIGVDYDRGADGFAIAYVYDGNGNLTRQKSLARDANHNGLPDLWEFLHGLTNNASAYADTDGDGWTDFQEWKAGTSPTNQLDTPKPGGAPQTPPIAQVLPAGSAVGALALIPIRLWDGEGSPSVPELQFQPVGSTDWTNAALLLVDNASWSTNSFVAAPPTGTNHILCWNAATNFPAGTSIDVALRARATDVTTNGEWSHPMLYRVEIPAGPATPPRLTPHPIGLDGSFEASIESIVGSHLTIEASTNLMHWEPVTTLLQTNSSVNFRDPTATNLNRRFYRVIAR